MNISCNHHAQSFNHKYAVENEYHPLTDTPLGLVGDYTFFYDYPLSNEAQSDHSLAASMSAIDILLIAKADYEHIYAAEENAVGNPGHIPGMFNRQTSGGPYGIWGHDFSDLYFECIYINETKKTVKFGMGS